MKQNTEIERKFLVTNFSYRQQATRHFEIVQGYLCKDPERTIRVRIRDARAFLTIKSSSKQGGIARFEWEKEIDAADARQLLDLCLPGVIEKTRYIVPAKDLRGHTEKPLVWEIDEFHGNLEGLVLAEIEVESEEACFALPSFAGREVTGDPHYYNSYLRKTTYLDL